jgi:hypothetical protein
MRSNEIASNLFLPEQWLESFLQETQTERADTIPLCDSRKSAELLLKKIKRLTHTIYDGSHSGLALSIDDVGLLMSYLKEFEANFARECKRLEVFTVTKKGIYESRDLIQNAERVFPENLLKVIPQQTIDDLRQAGKCLAFELPTACAFHICRGTEALMLRYYEVLTGQQWTERGRGWGAYNRQLIQNNAPRAITNRLEEIREDRNSYAHPSVTISTEDAPIIFSLCNEVIRQMAKEIEKLLQSSTRTP